MTLIKSPGCGSETVKTCPQCGETFPALIQTIAGVELAVGACPKCFSRPAKEPLPATPAGEPVDVGLEPVTKPCATCGKDYTTHAIRILGKLRDFGRICEPCTDALRTKAVSDKQAAFVAARKAEWEHICPEFYRGDAITAAIPPEKLGMLRKAWKEHGGVLVHGPSGAFKTTAAFHAIIKGLVWSRTPVRFISAMEWKPKCSAAAKECTTERFLAPYIKTPVLFLDDVGNMGGTPSSIEALHSLLEQRMRLKLPVIATTQYTGKSLVEKIGSTEAGDAIVRRLALVCRTNVKFT